MTSRNFKPAVPAILVGIALAGCATVPPPPPAPAPALPGYTFGYAVTGKVKADVVSDADKTWIVLPPGVRLQQAEGDGRNIHYKHRGTYWIADGLANDWTLYTSDGPLKASAPDTVGVMLAASAQAKAAKPHYSDRVAATTVSFAHASSTMDAAALSRLSDFAAKLAHAHRVIRIVVSGQTTGKDASATNATLGAARSQAVKTWLESHGLAPVKDMGWTAGGYPAAATLAAVYRVDTRKKPDTATVKTPGMKVPPKTQSAASSPTPAPAPPSTKPAHPKQHGYVFRVKAGQTLSSQLGDFLDSAGMKLVWTAKSDLDVRYAGTYKDASLKHLLMAVAHDYGLRIRIYRTNHIVTVDLPEAK